MGVGDEATRTKLTTLKKKPKTQLLPNWINITPSQKHQHTHTHAHTHTTRNNIKISITHHPSIHN
jgi:hypothetical protein